MKKIITLFVFSILFMTSCKEAKTESTKEENQETAMVYQCPMDCELGKTYDEPGTCPVCKMDLKAVGGETAMSCKMHKDGECDCNKEQQGKHHSSENGEKVACAMHEDGNCTCEGDACSCENCPEHA
ncbi:heavy metal-binding domain-containing protein [Cellulophaga sp. Hel_I_12]|uniref:heavy metal-binding domain-containing protein n=1 Tax=Cellulophaga sp. Hel_I_12 TaxID=1249972 RepID=UPI00068E9B77|nr:heavy metal-binding domain-containing protein [Cellulophaga sp. Hel_I_12]